MTTESIIKLFLQNLSLGMFFIAIVLAFFNFLIRMRTTSFPEALFSWMALLAVGVTGIFTFVLHVFFSEYAAAHIGWSTSPFQFEVGMADLALGVLGILAFRASYGFRLATVIAAVCFYWGDAVGHVYQMLVNKNFAPGNAGSWFWMDIVIPLVLIFCIVKIKPNRN